jgi:hypothetical protein
VQADHREIPYAGEALDGRKLGRKPIQMLALSPC